MESFTVLFLTALLVATGVQLWLALRQINHVAGHADRVPAQFHGRITEQQHRKAADYTVARVRLGIVDLVVSTCMVLIWTLGGGIDWMFAFVAPWFDDTLLTGTALLVGVMLIGGLVGLPLEIAAVFGIEQRFGFNRTRPITFITDLVKKTFLSLLLGVPIAAAVLWTMDAAGTHWWLAAWALWLAVNLLAVWAFPVLIAPLFNKFTPLQDEALAGRIAALLGRHGFAASGIFVADGSRRSGHGNAYFTGLGASKRIVFYDTLLADLEADEVEAVLAHEVGHFKRKHIAKQLGFSAAIVLAALALLAWLATQPWFYSSLGVETPGTAQALLLFLLAAPAFFFFLSPAMSLLSRKHEYEADAFAAENADGAVLVKALVKLYRSNSATLTPDPWYSAFHDSHPPAPLRIARLEAL
ncbi:MAG: M48 family metallopeptidase [Pseudomonadota bacterium]